MPKQDSLSGLTFGRLFAYEEGPSYFPPNGGSRHRRYFCRCTCGNTLLVRGYDLLSGNTQSCGCFHRDRTREVSTTHGHSTRNGDSRTYQSWAGMKARCGNTNDMDYGGRGIKFCERLGQFAGFLAVLGERPPRLEIDRWPNNDIGNYSCGACDECIRNGWPFNVRWATRKQNGRNKRNNLVFTVRGVTGCLSELCEHFQMTYACALARLRKGWPIEDVLLRPKRHY